MNNSKEYNIKKLLLNTQLDRDGVYRFVISDNLIYLNLDTLRRFVSLGLVSIDESCRPFKTVEILDKEAVDALIAMENL